jgi:cytochrome c-type biogenesis protein CcmE
MKLRRFKLGFEAALVAAILLFGMALTSIAHADATLAPSTVTAATTNYDGQSITVTGTVKNIQTRQMKRGGTLTTYDLCDTACISVVDFTTPTLKEGDTHVVTGKFQTSVPRFHETNVVTVGGMAGGFHGGHGGGPGGPP